MAPVPKQQIVECTDCGASGKLSGLIHKKGCSCPGTYDAPGTRAKAAIAANPEKSNRAIADAIGVTDMTVLRARKSEGATNVAPEKRLGKDGKSYPAKRPLTEKQAKIVALKDSGMSEREIALEAGTSERYVGLTKQLQRGQEETEAQIDPATLSATAQEKLAAAMRQQERRLDLAFETRVREECRKRIDDIILPEYLKEIADAKEVIKARKGVMRRVTFKKILACLHPDLVDKERRVRYTEAFQLFKDLEIVLCNEVELPTPAMDMPRSYAEALARKQKVSEARRRRPAPPSGPSAPARNL